MIYFNLIVIVAFAVLAILSRKHYSKYKDGSGIIAAVKAVVMSVGDGVWTFFANVLPLDGLKLRIRQQLRKNQVVSDKELELITDRFLAGCVGMACGIIMASNLLELGSAITRNLYRDDRNVIIRDEFGGDVVKEEISCQISGKEEIVIMEISPVRLSQEEFSRIPRLIPLSPRPKGTGRLTRETQK